MFMERPHRTWTLIPTSGELPQETSLITAFSFLGRASLASWTTYKLKLLDLLHENPGLRVFHSYCESISIPIRIMGDLNFPVLGGDELTN